MSKLGLNFEFDLSELAYQITVEMDDDDIMEFILQIEEHVMDWRFTKKLRDKLSEMIDTAKEEGEL